jgi:hypothetical protein
MSSKLLCEGLAKLEKRRHQRKMTTQKNVGDDHAVFHRKPIKSAKVICSQIVTLNQTQADL